MRGPFRLPMFVIAAALVALMALLATLQYVWLGQISDAERERMTATVNARAAAFAADFDRELTLAYMLFQLDPLVATDNLAQRLGARYDRWQSTARHPRLVAECYVVTRNGEQAALQRFNATTRFLEPVEWPERLRDLRTHVTSIREESGPRGTFVVRAATGPLWEQVPALVVPMPRVLFAARAREMHEGLRLAPFLSYTVLVLDRDYIARDLLPALAQQHFRGAGEALDYHVAVVSTSRQDAVFASPGFVAPRADTRVDASADMFQVRTQDFAQMAAEVRRFTATLAVPPGARTHTFTAVTRPGGAGPQASRPPLPGSGEAGLVLRESPLSIVVQETEGSPDKAAPHDKTLIASAASAIARPAQAGAGWRLLVQHPSGSLEAAVNSARRRNLLISTSILAVLGASIALLVLSTRRSQQVARQQMEFVAAVSHELRTPLAVIRSAGDNLAEGVVGDLAQARKYGELVRAEGRRLSEMVEQILEFAGIHSGQRRFDPRPLDVRALLDDVVHACGALVDQARMRVEYDIPADLPPVAGDPAALRRVFQNLVGNAIKYGQDGGWIGLRARAAGGEIQVTVADRGFGIPPAEQARIFEPFYRAPEVVAAQIQGAGLGLSLVARIVEAHGGRVTVQSTPGSGSEFTVSLPAASGEAAEGAGVRQGQASDCFAGGPGSSAPVPPGIS